MLMARDRIERRLTVASGSAEAGVGDMGVAQVLSVAGAASEVEARLLSRSLLPINLRSPETRLLLFFVCLRATVTGTSEPGSAGEIEDAANTDVAATSALDLLVGLPGTPLMLAEAMRLPLAVAVVWLAASSAPAPCGNGLDAC